MATSPVKGQLVSPAIVLKQVLLALLVSTVEGRYSLLFPDEKRVRFDCEEKYLQVTKHDMFHRGLVLPPNGCWLQIG